jgi:hypothetical protein
MVRRVTSKTRLFSKKRPWRLKFVFSRRLYNGLFIINSEFTYAGHTVLRGRQSALADVTA